MLTKLNHFDNVTSPYPLLLTHQYSLYCFQVFI
jgi:hypothetical protein